MRVCMSVCVCVVCVYTALGCTTMRTLISCSWIFAPSLASAAVWLPPPPLSFSFSFSLSLSLLLNVEVLVTFFVLFTLTFEATPWRTDVLSLWVHSACSSTLSPGAVLGLLRTPVWALSLFLGLSRNGFKVPATMCLCEAVASVVTVGTERSRVASSRLSLASWSFVRLGEEEEEDR